MNAIKNLLNKKVFNLPMSICLLLVLNTFNTMYDHSGILYFPNVILYPIYTIEIVLYLVLIIPNLIDKKEDIKNKVLFILLLALSIICGINSRYYLFSYTIATCYAVYKQETKDIIKVLLISVFIGLSVQIVLYYYETIFNNAEFNLVIRDGIIRYSFEVGHPNLLALYIFSIQLMVLYICHDKQNFLVYVVLVLVSIGSYYINYSRTTLIISLFALLLFYLSNISFVKKAIDCFSKYSFAVCLIAFILIMFGLSKNIAIANYFDKLIVGRGELSNIALKECGLSSFGQYIKYKDLYFIDEDFFIDSIYPYLAIEYGYVWLIILSVLFIFGLKNASTKDNILLIIFSIYGLTEHYGLEITCLCSIVLLKNIYCKNGIQEKVIIEKISDEDCSIDPNFIYNRFDMFSNYYSVYKCTYLEKEYFVETEIKDDIARLGLWMSEIPSIVISELAKHIFTNYEVERIEFSNYKNKVDDFVCTKSNHFTINLPNNVDELMSSISKSARYTITRKQKDFIKEFGDYKIEEYSSIPDSIINKYFELKKVTHHIDYNMSPKEYLDTYHITNGYVMYLKDEIIAMLFSCEQCPIANFENFTYDTKYSKYSIGKIIYDEYICKLVNHDIKTVFLGGGDYDYKRRYNSIEDVVYDGVMYRNSIKNNINILINSLLGLGSKIKHKLVK